MACSGRCHAPIKSRRVIPDRRRATQRKPVRPQGRQRESESARRRSEPHRKTGRHRLHPNSKRESGRAGRDWGHARNGRRAEGPALAPRASASRELRKRRSSDGTRLPVVRTGSELHLGRGASFHTVAAATHVSGANLRAHPSQVVPRPNHERPARALVMPEHRLRSRRGPAAAPRCSNRASSIRKVAPSRILWAGRLGNGHTPAVSEPDEVVDLYGASYGGFASDVYAEVPGRKSARTAA
jgi:hypothetical protein